MYHFPAGFMLHKCGVVRLSFNEDLTKFGNYARDGGRFDPH